MPEPDIIHQRAQVRILSERTTKLMRFASASETVIAEAKAIRGLSVNPQQSAGLRNQILRTCRELEQTLALLPPPSVSSVSSV